MLADRGYRVGESTYAEWESGYKKQPAKDAMPHLIALWGSEPEPEPVNAPGAPDTALLLAIEKQTDLLASQWEATVGLTNAILELVREVRSERKDLMTGQETIVTLLARLEVAATPASKEAEGGRPRRPSRG